ncbi:MAG: serine/threonine-protein kinase, partial [Phycisphaerae bacterium]|nr:serine/threonine-protein kinase [Phycisphaerae bacterium]
MTPPHDRERDIFEASLGLSPAARRDYIRDAADGDRALEDRVNRLLAAHERRGSATHSVEAGVPAIPDDVERVGPYTLLERIGEGGMGVVYVAEQKHPVYRRVALKLIKAGMDTKEVIARFHSERQALALMNHANIAGILDAGATETGRPYFVMEYVPGMPLIDYCDRHRLEIDARVKLFVDVCMAVQHAHQKGIIHRDIKPSNILVMEDNGRPVAKVIDFGVAKAISRSLSDVTLHTQIGGFLGTPEYVSPEQAEKTTLDVDTRADVYSLGAVLYELLSGERPFDFRDSVYAEIQDTIRERDPSPPSVRVEERTFDRAAAWRTRVTPESLVRKLRGDLDWITMKAMEKDRVRRYSSASELAADLTRHLNQEPVVAGPPSTTYRLGKFARRHSVLLLLAGIAAFALVTAVAGTTFGLLRARQAAEGSAVQAAIAEEVNAFLNDDLLAAVAPDQLGIAISVREVLDRAAQRIEGKFPERPLVEASIRRTIGTTYARLGEYAAAEPHLVRALALHEDTHGATHPETLAGLVDVGALARLRGRHAEAEPLLRAALDGRRQVLGDDHVDTLDSMKELAILYEAIGLYSDAERLYVESLEARRQHHGADDPGTLEIAEDLSILYQHMGQYEAAERLQLEAWMGMRRTLGEEHPETLNSVINLTALYLRQGRFTEAEPLLVENVEAQRRVMGAEHPRTLMSMNNLGYLYECIGRFDEAERLLLEALTIKSRVVGEEHPSTLESLDSLIDLYRKSGDDAKLEMRTVQLLAVRKRKAERAAASPMAKHEYARLLLDAEPERLRAAGVAVRFAVEANAATGYTNAGFLRTLAQAYYETGDRTRAVEVGEQALARTPAEQT